MSARRHCLALPLCAIAIHATVARAQSSEPVPRDLVEALLTSNFATMNVLGGVMNSRPIITVGRFPGNVPERLYVPAGARVLGGASTGAGSVSYYMTTLPRDSIVARYRREMPMLGWTDGRAPDDMRPPWGFVDPPRSRDTTGRGSYWCGPSGGIAIDIEPGVAERRVSILAGGVTAYLCQQRDRTAAVRSAWERYPTLENPPSGGPDLCASYSGSGSGAKGAFTSRLSIDSVLTHYTRQMLDSGWTAIEVPISARRFSRRDSTGTEVLIEVGVRSPAYSPDCREVYMDRWERRR